MTTTQLPCRAPGCRALRLASTYSNLCPGHRKAQARHGDPLQAPITLHHLGPSLAAVKGWRKRNPGSPAWAILADRWARLATHARDALAARAAGRTYFRHEAQAAALLVQVADSVDPQEVITMALAVYLLRDGEPSRFASERSFRFVLTRRVRKLAPLAVASYWSQKAQRMTGVYRDPPPRAAEVLGAWLVECFGPAGLQLAQLERQRVQQAAQEGTRLADALGALA